jgi:hypothetical protein
LVVGWLRIGGGWLWVGGGSAALAPMRVLSSGSHPHPTIGEDGATMKTLWKALLALALLVPMGAYVAGSLVASAADDPAPRSPIVIKDPGRSATPTGTPSSSPSPSTGVGEIELDPDDLDDDSDDSGRDDDHGDDHGDDEDHSGPGGGGDDGGHGSNDD